MNTRGEVLFEARDVRFCYTPLRPVINGVSIVLRRGEMAAVIGPNGCGKSTLIRLLAGLLVPEAGRIAFEGRPLVSVDRRELAKRVAYVPQNTARTFPFTALEVVLTGRSPYVSRFQFESGRDVEAAWESLEAAGVAHLAHRRVTELSGGERQLVSVARALAQQAGCLLLDEPSASLDLKHRAGVMRALSDLRSRKELTVLMVTHDLSLLEPCFDAVIAMRAGTVAAQGPPSSVLRESALADIYDDPRIRTCRAEGRTFVWSEP